VLDYKDLQDAIGGEPIEIAVANPEKERKIKQEVLDILYDADLLRQRSRRFSAERAGSSAMARSFVSLEPAAEVEADAKSHQEWIDRSKRLLTQSSSGSGDCFKLLRYSPAS